MEEQIDIRFGLLLLIVGFAWQFAGNLGLSPTSTMRWISVIGLATIIAFFLFGRRRWITKRGDRLIDEVMASN